LTLSTAYVRIMSENKEKNHKMLKIVNNINKIINVSRGIICVVFVDLWAAK